MKKSLGNVSKTKKDIQENINRVKLQSNSLIKLDKEDFNSLKEVYYHTNYLVDNVNDFKFFLEEDDKIKTSGIVVNITSNTGITLFEQSVVLNELKSVFGKDMELIYGTNLDPEIKMTIIDIFLKS